MKRLIFIHTLILLWAMAHPAVAGHPIASAQFTESGTIHVVLDDGRAFDVPDDRSNRHRQQLAEWVAEGNAIAPADPVPLPTREEKIRRDPEFPKPGEFMEAFIDCRFNGNCTAAQNLRNRLNTLRAKYP